MKFWTHPSSIFSSGKRAKHLMIATNTGIRCDERASSMEQRQKKPLKFFIGRLLAEKTVVSMGKSLKHGGCALQTLKRNCERVGELKMTKSNYTKETSR